MYTKPNPSVEVHANTQNMQSFRLHYNDYTDAAEFISACNGLADEFFFENPLGLPAYLDVNDVGRIYEYLELAGKLESYSIAQWVDLYNQYCSNAGYPDDRIYMLDDEFFNIYFTDNPVGAVRATCFGSVNLANEYVKFNGYGNLESISKLRIDEHIDFDEIIEHVFENQHLYNL